LSCGAGTVVCISSSYPEPGRCQIQGEPSRWSGAEPRRRPELKRRNQFRPLFYWDFAVVPESGMEEPPSAIPLFPVTPGRYVRLIDVVGDSIRLSTPKVAAEMLKPCTGLFRWRIRRSAPDQGSAGKSPRRWASTMARNSRGAMTSTALPHWYRCQVISSQPPAVKRTVKLPSSSVSTC
jgi:hypothetical protein